MTTTDIIAMAREAGLMSFKYPALIAEPDWEATERFAAFVAAAERKRFAWTQEHWTEYERNIAAAAKAEEREQGQKWFDAVTAQHKQEILAEREACAVLCGQLSDSSRDLRFAAAIRARGETK